MRIITDSLNGKVVILLLQDGKILQNVRVAKDIYEMVLEAPEIAKSSKPGQFVNLKLSEKLDPLLRRPISLHRIDADRGTLALLYLVVGKGTAMMSRMEPGETLNVLGPLGNGWDCALPGQHAVLVGGGIGIAPLYPLAKALTAAGKQVSLIMGAKNSAYLTDGTDYAQLGAEVTACDIHPHRVSLIEKYAASLNVKLAARLNDATVFNKEFENAFDIVLCDVPCSGFGVVSSKPDIKLFKTDAAISSLAQTQKKILETACRYVRRGGRLVYSTCTLFKAENGDVVNEFLSAHGNFAVEEIRLDYPKTKEGYLQFLPHRDGTDGFFIALLKREY